MNHIPIRVSTLRGDQAIDFDAFVKINEKFILYCRKGDSFAGERLSRLKEKKLKKMFIIENEEMNYRKYLERNIEMAMDSKSGKSIEIRSAIVQGSTQANTEDVIENPQDSQAYSNAREGSLRFVEFLAKEDKATAHLLNMENLDGNIAQHGVTVSGLAVTLALRMGLTDSKRNQLLALGALLHDYEHFHTPLNIAVPVSQMTEEEFLKYRQHPLAGAKRLQDKKHFDQTVLNIISQHEEYINGSGFPHGLNESKTDPLAAIVASANKVDRLLTFEKIAPDAVAKNLIINYTGLHPLEHLKILGEITNSLKS